MRLFLSVLAIALALAAPLRASDTEAANRLFVEAVLAWQAAEAVPGNGAEAAARRADLLATVAGNLERIVTDHAGADLAVRLVIGERIGPLSLAAARAALAQAEGESLRLTCLAAPDRACVRALALQAAEAIEFDGIRALTLGAMALSLEEPELFDLAKNAALAVKSGYSRDTSLSSISFYQALSGLFNAARDTAAMIADEDGREDALETILEIETDAPRPAPVLEPADEPDPPRSKVIELDAIIEARRDKRRTQETIVEQAGIALETGDRPLFRQALELAILFDGAEFSAETLAQIAALLPRP